MMENDRLAAVLRSAVPPVVTPGPERDLWPLILERSRERPRWSWVDVGLAAAAALGLLMRPDLLILLAYHF